MFNDSICDCFTFCCVIVTHIVRGTFKEWPISLCSDVNEFHLPSKNNTCYLHSWHVSQPFKSINCIFNEISQSIQLPFKWWCLNLPPEKLWKACCTPSTLFGNNNLTRNHSPFIHMRYCGSLKLLNVQTVVANHNCRILFCFTSLQTSTAQFNEMAFHSHK